MQPLEIALFVVVAALALGLLATLSRPYWRGGAGRGKGTTGDTSALGAAAGGEGGPIRAPGLVCPACHREFEPGLQFCPHDARDLVPAHDPAARGAIPGMTCPSCRRSYDAGKKFCAFDGEELVPLTVAVGGAELAVARFAGALGKICPSCSRRYEADASFCGRDGAELVSVN
jgi:predicted amidophosphoribosyltransferase